MKPIISLLAVLVLQVAVSASSVSRIPTTEEAQAKIENAISQANRIRVEHVWTENLQGIPPARRRIFICEITAESEVKALSRCLRLVTLGGGGVDCMDYFVVHIQKNETTLFDVMVFDGQMVRSDALYDHSMIAVDAGAFRPFYDHIFSLLGNILTEKWEKGLYGDLCKEREMALANELKANQSPQSTTPSVTPPAGQEARQP